jgi:hypothetical protein
MAGNSNDSRGYKCCCTARQLFEAGCSCGAFAQHKKDKEAIERVEIYEARERLQKEADFLIGKPTPPIKDKTAMDEEVTPVSPWFAPSGLGAFQFKCTTCNKAMADCICIPSPP